MNVTNKIILVTGGGSGIGFEISKQLIAKNNTVIIVGRTESRLKEAAEKLGKVSYLACDITKPTDSKKLKNYLIENFGELDMLVNNAGHAYVYTLGADDSTAAKAMEEFNTNVFSPMRLIDELLPLLKASNEGVIVNTTSLVALAPAGSIPTYSASKAALHSYTELLRDALSKNSTIKVFELMPPLVDTELSTEIGGKHGMPPAGVAAALMQGLENNEYEIHVGDTATIYSLSRAATYAEAFKIMNS